MIPVHDGDLVEGRGLVLPSERGPFLVRESRTYRPRYSYPTDSSGVLLRSLPSIDMGSTISIQGVWQDQAIDVTKVISVTDSTPTGSEPFARQLGPRRRAASVDIVETNRDAGGHLTILVSADTPEPDAWASARIKVSAWSRGQLEAARARLERLPSLIALGQTNSPEGDLVLIVGLTHLTEEAVRVLGALPDHLVQVHTLVRSMA